MARKERFLTDKQWSKIESLLPARKLSPKGGRPACDSREVLEGILWILRTGTPWADFPKEYPSASTCWRRLSQRQEEDIWLKIWSTFLQQLDDAGKLDWHENFGDGYFSAAKEGALRWEKPSGAKAQSFLVVVDGQGFPIGNYCCSASTHEAKLAEETLSHVVTERKPEVLVYDRAADSDPLRVRLKEEGIELVCPHRSNRNKNSTQD